MTQYLISFGARAMDHIPGEDAPAVARAAHAVQEAINARVHVSADGPENQPASIVSADGAVTDGPYPEAIGRISNVIKVKLQVILFSPRDLACRPYGVGQRSSPGGWTQ